MKKSIFTFICFLSASLFNMQNAGAQCQAVFTVYQDTTVGAPAHTYIGENNCIGANFMGIDTINYTYTWTWGDGTATTAPFPSHTYASTGNYTICLYMNPVNPAGCSDSICINATINKNSAMAYIKIKNPFLVAGTKDFSQNTLSIFPNPVADKLFIKGLQKENYHVAVYSIEGKIVATPLLQNHEFVSIAELAAGNYILKVTGADNKTNVLKFYKN